MQKFMLIGIAVIALSFAGCSDNAASTSARPDSLDGDMAPSTVLAAGEAELLALELIDESESGENADKGRRQQFLNKVKSYLVVKALERGDSRPVSWFVSEAGYTQHNLTFPDGRDVLIHAIDDGLLDGTTAQVQRIYADGEIVVLHTKYFLFGRDLAGFDVFRFENGQIVEHWDNLGPIAEDGDGTTQFDGPRRVRDRRLTGQNRSLVTDFVTNVLVGGQWSTWPLYVSEDQYIQHAVGIPSGTEFLDQFPDGFQFFSSLEYVHAEGNFVLTMSEGYPDPETGLATAYYDLFRVKRGKIVEHWDVTEVIPPAEEWANPNGKW